MKIEHDPDSACGGCPFRSDDWNSIDWCSDDVCAADSERRDVHGDRPAPEWCPLRSGDVIVTARREQPTLEVGNERGAK